MKYRRTDVVLGLLEADRQAQLRLKADHQKAQDELGVATKTQDADWAAWRENVENLIDMVDSGYKRPTSGEYTNTINSPVLVDGRVRSLGLSKHKLVEVQKAVENTYQALIDQKPSDLTVFLTSIDDEFITDMGIRAAGFDHRGLGRYVAMGLKVKS